MVSGVVALTKTAAGVPNAIVALIRGGEVIQAAPTDASGRFAFRDVPTGSYTVRLTGLELTGLPLRNFSFAPLEEPIQVGASPVEVFFAGNGLVPPRVVGEVRCNGAPVVGATVRVVGGETDKLVATNTQGKFSATDLEAGTYAAILVGTPSPCTFAVPYAVVRLKEGQAATADFTGTS